MKKFAIVSGLVTLAATIFSNCVASFMAFNQPKSPSMLG